jgi:glutamate decarboxylase
MSLHIVSESSDVAIDDVYATLSSDQRVQKYRMPNYTSSSQVIYDLVHDELLLDGNSRQNIATFSTTLAEPEAHRLMNESLDKKHDL